MRLIDADAIEYTHAIARSLDDGHNWNELCVTKDEIEDMPTIQPERIIHCKDCEWWTKQECSPQGRCALSGMYPTGGWFCGNARRREVTI